jgi:hypothetical protein
VPVKARSAGTYPRGTPVGPLPDRSLLRRGLFLSIPKCSEESQVAVPPGVRVRSWSFLGQRFHDGLVGSFRAPDLGFFALGLRHQSIFEQMPGQQL